MGVPTRCYGLADAREKAEELCQALGPACERIQVAGSIRRGCDSVKDIELVAVSRIENRDLFAILPYYVLEDSLVQMVAYDRRARRRRGEAWGPRYKRFRWEGLPVDLFMVRPPAEWAVILAIRTGPADFSQWLVTPKERGGALPEGYRIFGGQLLAWDKPVPTPTEESFFEAIGVQFLAPEDRARFLNSATTHGGPHGQAHFDSADG